METACEINEKKVIHPFAFRVHTVIYSYNLYNGTIRLIILFLLAFDWKNSKWFSYRSSGILFDKKMSCKIRFQATE